MNKTSKIALNILLFLLIAGFGYYMVLSITSEENTTQPDEENTRETFVSPYEKISSFEADYEIRSFYIYENAIYVALYNKVSVFDISGKHQYDFSIEKKPCDIVVDETAVYLLYPAGIGLYSSNGQKTGDWEACGDNSDYCALTVTKEYVFVTDAENKNIVQYDKQGGLVRFIQSPEGFIIPSYAFDIISINDTVYCVNSGRHQIESYTSDGEFIDSFGKSGAEAGAFAGCCNPVYLAKSSGGHILTSEKGNPRISCYGKKGKFRSILFDSHTLGDGTAAYEMKVSGENLYISNKKTISIYGYRKDIINCVSTGKSCDGCKKNCPLRKGVNH